MYAQSNLYYSLKTVQLALTENSFLSENNASSAKLFTVITGIRYALRNARVLQRTFSYIEKCTIGFPPQEIHARRVCLDEIVKPLSEAASLEIELPEKIGDQIIEILRPLFELCDRALYRSMSLWGWSNAQGARVFIVDSGSPIYDISMGTTTDNISDAVAAYSTVEYMFLDSLYSHMGLHGVWILVNDVKWAFHPERQDIAMCFSSTWNGHLEYICHLLWDSWEQPSQTLYRSYILLHRGWQSVYCSDITEDPLDDSEDFSYSGYSSGFIDSSEFPKYYGETES